MSRLEQTILNLKAMRRFAPSDEILAERTMDEYYKDEAVFIMAVEDALNAKTNEALNKTG